MKTQDWNTKHRAAIFGTLLQAGNLNIAGKATNEKRAGLAAQLQETLTAAGISGPAEAATELCAVVDDLKASLFASVAKGDKEASKAASNRLTAAGQLIGRAIKAQWPEERPWRVKTHKTEASKAVMAKTPPTPRARLFGQLKKAFPNLSPEYIAENLKTLHVGNADIKAARQAEAEYQATEARQHAIELRSEEIEVFASRVTTLAMQRKVKGTLIASILLDSGQVDADVYEGYLQRQAANA